MSPEIATALQVLKGRRYHIDLAIQALERLDTEPTAEALTPPVPAAETRLAPPSVPATVRRTPTPRARPAAPTIESSDGAELLKTLAKKPLSTGDLAQAVSRKKLAVLRTMRALEGKGLAHSSGTRRGQRWHLGAQGSRPKEAESRSRG